MNNNEIKKALRPIKFRGLRTDGKGWVYGLIVKRKSKLFIEVEFTDLEDEVIYRAYEVIPETVGQFLAVIGKNTEVYTGDILVNPQRRKHTVVIWDNLPCLHYTDKGRDYYQPMTQGFLNNKTVIGNIHQESEVNHG